MALQGVERQPDGALTVDPEELPDFDEQDSQFVINPYGNLYSPVFVYEIAVSNETMVKLATVDVDRYFGADPGTREWVGVKVFKNENGTTRWWAGHAIRDLLPNGRFANTFSWDPLTFPQVDSHNIPITTPTDVVFNISVDRLIHPFQRPQGYPANLPIDLEAARRKAVKGLRL